VLLQKLNFSGQVGGERNLTQIRGEKETACRCLEGDLVIRDKEHSSVVKGVDQGRSFKCGNDTLLRLAFKEDKK